MSIVHEMNIEALILKLLSLNKKRGEPLKDNQKVPTTIRLDPIIRQFLDDTSQSLGISIQELSTMIFKGVMICSQLQNDRQLDKIPQRFLDVFENHKIPVFDIPKFFPNKELKLTTLMSPESILDFIDYSVLEIMEKYFLVNQDWLKGLDPFRITSSRKIYPYFDDLIDFIKSYRSRENSFTISKFSLLICHRSENQFSYSLFEKAKSFGDTFESQDICVVLKIDHLLDGISFTTYQPFETLRWNYIKCRHTIKSLIKLARKWRIKVIVGTIPKNQFTMLTLGKELPAATINNYFKFSSFCFDTLIENNESNPEADEHDQFMNFYVEKKFDQLENIFSAQLQE